MRPDLPRGVLASMVVHAVGESVREPHPDGLHAVVLAATPDQLEELKRVLTAASVPHRTIVEPDSPYLNEVMAIGVTPAAKKELKRHLSTLPLLK